MIHDADFVVVGAGVAAASVASHLAKQASVLVLEAEERPGVHATVVVATREQLAALDVMYRDGLDTFERIACEDLNGWFPCSVSSQTPAGCWCHPPKKRMSSLMTPMLMTKPSPRVSSVSPPSQPSRFYGRPEPGRDCEPSASTVFPSSASHRRRRPSSGWRDKGVRDPDGSSERGAGRQPDPGTSSPGFRRSDLGQRPELDPVAKRGVRGVTGWPISQSRKAARLSDTVIAVG